MKPQIKKHAFIEQNITSVKTLISSGDLSGKVMSQYKIYEKFREKKAKFRMQRYQDTAHDCKCSIQTVMNAVKSMESNIRQF